MLRLSDIMTVNVATLAPETTLRDAVELLSARHISGAPVLSGQELIGIITASDIISFAASVAGSEADRSDAPTWSEWNDSASDEQPESENVAPGSYFTDLFDEGSTDVVDRMRSTDGRESNLLDEHTVDEVMTRAPIALGPHDSVLEAAELMRAKAIHRVLVVEDERLVGIVSALDVARAVAEQKLTSRRYMFNRDADFRERAED